MHNQANLNVALLQLAPIALSLTASLERGEQACRLARMLGADVALFRTRAYENMMGFATANYAAPVCNGRSVAYDGIGYENGYSRNMQLVQAGVSETIVLLVLILPSCASTARKSPMATNGADRVSMG